MGGSPQRRVLRTADPAWLAPMRRQHRSGADAGGPRTQLTVGIRAPIAAGVDATIPNVHAAHGSSLRRERPATRLTTRDGRAASIAAPSSGTSRSSRMPCTLITTSPWPHSEPRRQGASDVEPGLPTDGAYTDRTTSIPRGWRGSQRHSPRGTSTRQHLRGPLGQLPAVTLQSTWQSSTPRAT